MKILQLLPELRAGGVERGTVDLSRILIQKGHEAHVISAGGPLVQELEKIGAHHLELPIHKKSLRTLGLVKTVIRYVEENGIDIIHARSRVPAWVGYLAARYTDADFITTCHGYYSTHLMSRVMGWGKRVIVISNVIGRHMIDDFGVPEDRIRLIPRGVDLDHFTYSPLADRLPKKNEPFRIINVGRITPLKGHLDFIRALHWAKKRGKNFEAWIVGSAPESKADHFQEITRLVEKLGLGPQVKFLGTRYDIPELLKQTHISVLSTKTQEAFGRAVAEAGAVGTAVIATQVGGVTDIVRDGEEGRMVPPSDPEKLGEAICRAMEDLESTCRYSENLRKRVAENFHLEQMYEKTLRVYQETYEEKRILVIKLGALGDVVLISPSLRLLRTRYPKAHIALLVDEKFYEVAIQFPYVDEVIVYRRGKARGRFRRYLKVFKKVRAARFDISIDFQNTRKTHLLAYLAGIPKRLGYGRGLFRSVLTAAQPGFKDPLPPIPHQFRVLRALGLGMGSCDETLELRPSGVASASAERLLAENGLGTSGEKKLLIGFALSASAKWPSKNWPLENYIQLGRTLIERYPAQMVLFGTASELSLTEAFSEHFPEGSVIDLVGKTGIGELLGVIQRMDLLVGPDSAPLHIASAFHVPLIGLFGPTDARRHAPLGEKKVIFQKSVPCGPCYERECPIKTHDCMKLITVDEVLTAAKRFLDIKAGISPSPQPSPIKGEGVRKNPSLDGRERYARPVPSPLVGEDR